MSEFVIECDVRCRNYQTIACDRSDDVTYLVFDSVDNIIALFSQRTRSRSGAGSRSRLMGWEGGSRGGRVTGRLGRRSPHNYYVIKNNKYGFEYDRIPTEITRKET